MRSALYKILGAVAKGQNIGRKSMDEHFYSVNRSGIDCFEFEDEMFQDGIFLRLDDVL